MVYVSMEIDLPVLPPVEPMLAKAQAKVPDEASWSYEPNAGRLPCAGVPGRRRSGVQCAQRQGTRPLLPELIEAVARRTAPRCVLDGEVVVPRQIDGRIRLDWDSLSQRIRPLKVESECCSPSRRRAHFIGFDALATGDQSLLSRTVPGTAQASSEAIAGTRW